MIFNELLINIIMYYHLIDYIEYIIIWVPILCSLSILLLISFLLSHLILIKLCDLLLMYWLNKSILNTQIKFAIIIQKYYKKKKLINELESLIPIIEEIYYTPGYKGFYKCKTRYETIYKHNFN